MLFGEKLKKLRTDAKMSQSELADKLGVTRRSIIYYESGTRYPKTRDIIVNIASVFNVSVDYLVSDKDEFIISAYAQYGAGGQSEALRLVEHIGALFAGGSLGDDDKDKVFKAIGDIYWESKEINKKYAHRSDKDK